MHIAIYIRTCNLIIHSYGKLQNVHDTKILWYAGFNQNVGKLAHFYFSYVGGIQEVPQPKN